MVLIGVLLLPASPALAQGDPDAATVPAIVFDVMVLRPVGLLVTVVGAGLFPVAALLAAPGGRDAIGEALDHFILAPGKSVFQRPLGEL